MSIKLFPVEFRVNLRNLNANAKSCDSQLNKPLVGAHFLSELANQTILLARHYKEDE